MLNLEVQAVHGNYVKVLLPGSQEPAVLNLTGAIVNIDSIINPVEFTSQELRNIN